MGKNYQNQKKNFSQQETNDIIIIHIVNKIKGLRL